jgi:predicted RNA binding protein YcfA (HicA-like mRNA interferase family)
MIPKSISGKELIKILLKKGYWVRDQKGSHVHLRHPMNLPLTVPVHKEIAIGTLKAIIKAAELDEKDFE